MANQDFRLEKITLSCGQILTGGCSFNIGKKDTPVHISRDGYVAKLRWIAQKHFVLWDEDDNRGWLINGISALLHLLRASLEVSRNDKFKSTFLFDFTKFKNSSELRYDSAISILLDEANRRLPIYPAKSETHTEKTINEAGMTETVTKTITTYTCLEDKVEELYDYLEKMIEHKSSLDNPSGIDAKVRLRRHLEGWDFRDLAANRDPFYLRVATLPSAAFSWIELTRSIQAVTLFGKGFGELYRPATTSLAHQVVLCSSWNSVPKRKYYLCASVDDLREIIQEVDGDLLANPITIAPRLVWQNPSRDRNPFEACPCTRQQFPRDHDFPIQHIILSKWSKLLPKGPLSLFGCEHGAVVFGQSMGFRFLWPESRDKDHSEINMDHTLRSLSASSEYGQTGSGLLQTVLDGSESTKSSRYKTYSPPSATFDTSGSIHATSDQTATTPSATEPSVPMEIPMPEIRAPTVGSPSSKVNRISKSKRIENKRVSSEPFKVALREFFRPGSGSGPPTSGPDAT